MLQRNNGKVIIFALLYEIYCYLLQYAISNSIFIFADIFEYKHLCVEFDHFLLWAFSTAIQIRFYIY